MDLLDEEKLANVPVLVFANKQVTLPLLLGPSGVPPGGILRKYSRGVISPVDAPLSAYPQ